MEEQPPERALRVEICEIQLAQHHVGGKKKIQTDEETAGPGNAFDFSQRELQVREIAQTVADEDTVERRVGERKHTGIGADGIRKTTGAGELKHTLGQVDRYDSRVRMPTV